MFLAIVIIALLAIGLCYLGREKSWGYAPASLLSLTFVLPIIMLLTGLL